MNTKYYSRKNLILLLALLFYVIQSSSAKVRLPQLISDKMVLQRDTELNIWGWADRGEKVTVRFQGKYYDAEPDETGKWMVVLPPQKAGGPFIIEVNEIIIRDVLIGDVWLCSGQSNQETPITRLVNRFPEINVSNNHYIRHYKAPSQSSPETVNEKTAGDAQWHSGIASEVMNWTALAFFFAQEAYAYNKIPVGMLVSSKGGTAIESWISQEYLKEFPQLLIDRVALDSLKIIEKDKGAGMWHLMDYDDSNWKTMNVPGKWRNQGINMRGVVWHRKDFELPASMERKHAKLYLGTLVDTDSVFVNGHFVGFTSYTYPPRNYDIPAGILRQGKNNITVKLTSNSGNGEFVADKIYKIVGDGVEVDLTGVWKYNLGKDFGKERQYRDRLKNLNTAGSDLYNGMIYPVGNYKVKGVIWYQGESNAGRPHEYKMLMKSLIANWRELWKMPDMPFLLVQLPNFMEKSEQPSESGWAAIREAQSKTAMETPGVAMAVTYDIGEWNDIHPLNKKDMAHRLVLGARKLVYGEKIICSGPVYKDMKIEGDKIILTFTETGGGLTTKNGPPKHFAIAGDDKRFVWAEAVIKGNTVIVSSRDVKNPVAVRYAWANNPQEANLCNREGLLASPFRTDKW
jgi:sialate O-acetylesterase